MTCVGCVPDDGAPSGRGRCAAEDCRATLTTKEAFKAERARTDFAGVGVLNRSDGKSWVAALVTPSEIVVLREAFELPLLHYLTRPVNDDDHLTYSFELPLPNGSVRATRIDSWSVTRDTSEAHNLAVAHITRPVTDVAPLVIRTSALGAGQTVVVAGFSHYEGSPIAVQAGGRAAEAAVLAIDDTGIAFSVASNADMSCEGSAGAALLVRAGDGVQLVGLVNNTLRTYDPCEGDHTAVSLAAHADWLAREADVHPDTTPPPTQPPTSSSDACQHDECAACAFDPACVWWVIPGVSECITLAAASSTRESSAFIATGSDQCAAADGIFRLGKASICFRDADCAVDEACVAGWCAPSHPRCERDRDCPPTQVCEAGQCTPTRAPECGDDAPCVDGEHCVHGVCLAVGPLCAADGVWCRAGDECIDGYCVHWPCDTEHACPMGLACNEGVCRYARCSATRDCPEGLLCDDGLCRLNPAGQPCDSDYVCEEGFVCDAGVCLARVE